jgi:hypothetical protein
VYELDQHRLQVHLPLVRHGKPRIFSAYVSIAVMLCGIGQAAVYSYTLIYEMTAEFLIPIQFGISAMPVLSRRPSLCEGA